jgi:hypothetical protein
MSGRTAVLWSAPKWDVYRLKSSAAFFGRVTAKDKAAVALLLVPAIELYLPRGSIVALSRSSAPHERPGLQPGLQRPATETRTRSESVQRWLTAVRRYAETEIAQLPWSLPAAEDGQASILPAEVTVPGGLRTWPHRGRTLSNRIPNPARCETRSTRLRAWQLVGSS